jgi:hypothetical protein
MGIPVVMDLVARPRAGIPAWCGFGGWRLMWLRGRYATVYGSGAVLWPGAPQWVESWHNGAVTLQTYGAGIWQAGCSFIR